MRFARAIGTQLTLGAILVFTSLFSNIAAHAATINYGNFGPVPPGVTFLGVTESSGTDPVPLYGPPTPFVVGLDFDPMNFVATATGGASDVTDGQLNLTIRGDSNGPIGFIAINQLNLSEAGDYTLAGAGTPATSVFAGAIMRITVTGVDGLPVAPVNLSPSTASVGFALPPTQVVQPWSLGTGVDIVSQVQALFGPNSYATRVDVVINNQLLALSQPGSVAFIAKKDFRLTVIPQPVGDIPEPATAVLVTLAVSLVGLVAKRSGR